MTEALEPDDPRRDTSVPTQDHGAAPGPLFPDQKVTAPPAAALPDGPITGQPQSQTPQRQTPPNQSDPWQKTPAASSDEEAAAVPAAAVPLSVSLASTALSPAFTGAGALPSAEGPTRAALATDVVTCPECGQWATVDMARRQADDFCKRCDFPLFWARGTVIAPDGEESGASLRRLPGTVGRAATAALICPHCSEPNSPAAEICVRCALSLHPVDIPEPEPVVIVAPEPEPVVEPEPKRGFDWWWIIALVTAVIAIALILGLIYLR
ncbi:MAG: hypothetical protein ABWZ98_15065 [Nakamurella sp.]